MSKLILLFLIASIIAELCTCSSLRNMTDSLDVWKYTEKKEVRIGLPSSIIHSLLMTFISEIADKTFIIILLFSSKNNKSSILIASLVAVLGMNYISILIGYSIDILLYKNVIDWIAFLTLIFYGISLISEAWEMSKKKVEDRYITMIEDEFKRKKTEHRSNMLRRNSERLSSIKEEESNLIDNSNNLSEPMLKSDNNSEVNKYDQDDESSIKFYWFFISSILSAECGDKSQISTITISALFNIYGVIIGTTIALLICVVVNIYFGHQLSRHLSEKYVNYICGTVLVLCGIEILLIKLDILYNF